MLERLWIILTSMGVFLIYSFFVYVISKIPFLGVHFNGYFICVAFISCVSLVMFSGNAFYYSLYDKVRLLQNQYVKYGIAWSLSFVVFFVFDLLFREAELHIIAKIVFSFCFIASFLDDYDSIRSLNRLKK